MSLAKRYPKAYRKLNRSIGQALHRYEMIKDGDRITVGLSGGMDSLTLLWFLSERRQRIPITYNILAVYIDTGFEGGFGEALARYCAQRDLDLRVEVTDYGLQGHSPHNRKNPCFLCSRLRRQRLFEVATETGSNKIALGHNKDDLIETLLLNMCYAGQLATMVPRQSFFDGQMTVVRPLALSDAQTIRRFGRQMGFPRFTNPCPSATTSKRSDVRALLKSLYHRNRKIKGNLFRSMQNVKPEYLL